MEWVSPPVAVANESSLPAEIEVSLCVCNIHVCLHLHYTNYVPTSVQSPVIYIAGLAICKYKCLHPPLCRFLGHVLQEGKPAFERYHLLIDAELASRTVHLTKFGKETRQEGPQFEKMIMACLPSRNVYTVVI